MRPPLSPILPLLLAVGCTTDTAAPTREVTIRFDLVAGAQPVDCSTPLFDDARLADARFYVSDLSLLTATGQELPVTLTGDGLYQSSRVALIDLEGRCETSGTEGQHRAVLGTVADEPAVGLAFTLGVPFELNHLDGSTAPAPLDNTAMYWGWQVGFKFLRLDLKVGEQAYNLHVGSIGCTSSSAVRPPDACTRPNRVTVRFNTFDPTTQAVALDLEALFDGVDLTANTEATPPGCQSDTSEPDDCTLAFSHLGLDFATGAAQGSPTAFKVRDAP